MKWSGSTKGIKGYTVWKFPTSNAIPGYPPAARYSKDGVFSLAYRRRGRKPDKREITEGIRDILNFKGKYLTIVEHSASSTTIEFYCHLEKMPMAIEMKKIEEILFSIN